MSDALDIAVKERERLIRTAFADKLTLSENGLESHLWGFREGWNACIVNLKENE